MRFADYYRSLKGVERDKYAARAGTTRQYIEIHLLAKSARRKTPRKETMVALAGASNGAVTLEEVIAHFFDLAA